MVSWNAPPGTNKIFYIELKAGFEKCIGLGDKKKNFSTENIGLGFC